MNTAIFDIPAIKRPQPPLMDLQEIPGRQDPVAVESFRKLLPQTIPVAAEWELNAFGPHQAAEIVRADVAKEHVTLYKAQSAASVDSQRNAHNSLNGHPRLISGDPGPKAFMEMADKLKHQWMSCRLWMQIWNLRYMRCARQEIRCPNGGFNRCNVCLPSPSVSKVSMQQRRKLWHQLCDE